MYILQWCIKLPSIWYSSPPHFFILILFPEIIVPFPHVIFFSTFIFPSPLYNLIFIPNRLHKPPPPVEEIKNFIHPWLCIQGNVSLVYESIPAAAGGDGVGARLLGLRVLRVGDILLRRDVRGLNRHQAQLRRFLSPAVKLDLMVFNGFVIAVVLLVIYIYMIFFTLTFKKIFLLMLFFT